MTSSLRSNDVPKRENKAQKKVGAFTIVLILVISSMLSFSTLIYTAPVVSANSGTYSVSLTVTDEYGATNTTTESVKVSGGISALTDEFDSITEIMILVLKVSVIASLITFCILRFKR